MFDIRKIAIGLTGDMPVRDVDGEVVKDEKNKPLSITFYSPGSKEHAKARVKLQNDLREEMEAEEAKAAKSSKLSAKKLVPEEDEPDRATLRTAQFLADITVSLNGFDYPGGPKALYLDATLGHIVEDADKFVMKRGNFKPNSVVASSSSSDTQPG